MNRRWRWWRRRWLVLVFCGVAIWGVVFSQSALANQKPELPGKLIAHGQQTLSDNGTGGLYACNYYVTGKALPWKRVIADCKLIKVAAAVITSGSQTHGGRGTTPPGAA